MELSWAIPKTPSTQLSGDCYAHATLAGLETVIRKQTGQLIDLSEEFAACGSLIKIKKDPDRLEERLQEAISSGNAVFGAASSGMEFIDYLLDNPQYLVEKFKIDEETYASIAKRVLTEDIGDASALKECFRGNCAIKNDTPFVLLTENLKRTILSALPLRDFGDGATIFQSQYRMNEKLRKDLSELESLSEFTPYSRSIKAIIDSPSLDKVKTLYEKAEKEFKTKLGEVLWRMSAVKYGIPDKDNPSRIIHKNTYSGNELDVSVNLLFEKLKIVLQKLIESKAHFDGKSLPDSELEDCIAYSKHLKKIINDKLCSGTPIIAAASITGMLMGSDFQSSQFQFSGMRIKPAVHAMLLVGIERVNGISFWKFVNSYGPTQRFAWMPMNEACRFQNLYTIEAKSNLDSDADRHEQNKP